ncbi:MAG: ribonuclease P protein component [Acidobacteriia bacterium]|nr:ribonuclease P protein component [Terriglobia bacterium]
MNGLSATPSNSRPVFRFPKSTRLLKRSDFRRVYDHGQRLGNSMFAVFFLRRETGPEAAPEPRIGFTVPKAVGKSVERNRIRRRMREAIRLELWRLDSGVDLVFHPRRLVLDAAFDQLRRQVERAFTKCRTS